MKGSWEAGWFGGKFVLRRWGPGAVKSAWPQTAGSRTLREAMNCLGLFGRIGRVIGVHRDAWREEGIDLGSRRVRQVSFGSCILEPVTKPTGVVPIRGRLACGRKFCDSLLGFPTFPDPTWITAALEDSLHGRTRKGGKESPGSSAPGRAAVPAGRSRHRRLPRGAAAHAGMLAAYERNSSFLVFGKGVKEWSKVSQ